MALYLGNQKVKINIGGIVYCLNFGTPLTNDVKLLTIDNYILTDSDGIQLATKGVE